METYFDLGSYCREITTSSDQAQKWFNRGLIWCYAFHHTEAVRCFKKVIEFDPTCAMGYWGLAYAIGPYYNITWDKMPEPLLKMALSETFENSRKAHSLVEGTSPIERALIEAFLMRFQASEVDHEVGNEETFAEWDDAYANAMRSVYTRFSEDYDICALTAEALMVRTPWQLWELASGKPADGADTLEVMEILETALYRAEELGDVRHPGLHHFYIHCMEMSPEPEKALVVSDRLRTMIPDAGHLNHMPSHIYVLCGQYAKTIDSNVDAVISDDKYLAVDNTPGIFYIYHSHNLHFQVYGALFSGQYAEALRATDEIEARLTEDVLRVDSPFIAHFLEWIYPVRPHIYIRFGKWDEIIAQTLPGDPDLYAVTTATWHYAKGIAYAVLGHIDQALEQQMLFRTALAALPEDRISYQNVSSEVLAVGDAMLDGELEYRRGNYDVAFDHLRRSVALYDNLNYAEPWTWMQPPRHALGALLLEQRHVMEAAQVYRADLGLDDTLQRSSQHPNNIWSLHGYAECCQLLGDEAEFKSIQKKLEEAQAVADIEVNASCFCRKADHCCS
ncbi:MAG: hypothetical protein AAF702_14845 [Chloroflexota bacterium]